jgi:hypothetical protein
MAGDPKSIVNGISDWSSSRLLETDHVDLTQRASTAKQNSICGASGAVRLIRLLLISGK